MATLLSLSRDGVMTLNNLQLKKSALLVLATQLTIFYFVCSLHIAIQPAVWSEFNV